jgi:hypothetical protein
LVESGYGNLIAELGIIGLLLWILLGSAIVFSAWQVVVKLRGTPWFQLACLCAILLFFPMMFVGSSAYQDYVLNAYFWLLLGILFRLQFLARALRINSDEATVRQA